MEDEIFKLLSPIGGEPPAVASSRLLEMGETLAGEQLASVTTERGEHFKNGDSYGLSKTVPGSTQTICSGMYRLPPIVPKP